MSRSRAPAWCVATLHAVRRLILLAVIPLALVACGTTQSEAAAGGSPTRPVGSPAKSDRAAAKHVKHSKWEPRPKNRKANHTMLTRKQIRYFRKHSDMPYAKRVTGHYRGTTDEIIQWAAYKHGIDVNVLRAVAVVETYWRQSFVGDNGDSFGLYQVRRPYHCCAKFARGSTAFNADYYGAIIRAYYDGKQGWLNDEERGQDYKPGDLWGSVGAWYAGRWHTPDAEQYIAKVKNALADRTWRTKSFAGAG
jgi:autotransporter family porin